MEVCGVQEEESCIGNLLLPSPLHSDPTPLHCLWATALGRGKGVGGDKETLNKALPSAIPGPSAQGVSSLMLDPLFFNSRIAEGAPTETQTQQKHE